MIIISVKYNMAKLLPAAHYTILLYLFQKKLLIGHNSFSDAKKSK